MLLYLARHVLLRLNGTGTFAARFSTRARQRLIVPPRLVPMDLISAELESKSNISVLRCWLFAKDECLRVARSFSGGITQPGACEEEKETKTIYSNQTYLRNQNLEPADDVRLPGKP